MSRSDDKQSGSLIPLVVIGVVLYSLFSGGGGDVPGPEPEPPGPVASDVDAAFNRYRKNWLEAACMLSDKLDGGEITSERQAAEWFGKANAAALKDAFTPLAESEYEQFGGEKWTAAKHAAVLRSYTGG